MGHMGGGVGIKSSLEKSLRYSRVHIGGFLGSKNFAFQPLTAWGRTRRPVMDTSLLLSRKSKAGELGAPWLGQELLLAQRWCLDAAQPGSLPLPVGTQTVSLFPVPRSFE